jgi:hypothetical protein
MMGLAVVGVAYVHGKRGGDASFDSIMDTLRYVWSNVAPRLGLEGKEQRSVHAAPPSRTAHNPRPANGLTGERTPRPQGS